MCRACMQCRVMAVMRTVGAPSASAVVRAAPLLLPYRRRREPPTPAHAAVLLSASAVMPAERWHCCRSVGPTAEAARARALVRREAVPRWPPAAAAPALAAAGHSLLPPTDHHAMVINRMRTQRRERERAREREGCEAQSAVSGVSLSKCGGECGWCRHGRSGTRGLPWHWGYAPRRLGRTAQTRPPGRSLAPPPCSRAPAVGVPGRPHTHAHTHTDAKTRAHAHSSGGSHRTERRESQSTQ